MLTVLENSSKDIPYEGSSTICIIQYDKKKKEINTCYMGDSLYMILSYNATEKIFQIKYKSEEQVHSFNRPFQIGTHGDDPRKSKQLSHAIKPKDIIIVASDGYIFFY